MGRIILIILLASFSISTYSQRVQNSKWSATLEVGANQFDGDMTPSVTKTSFGLSGEYTISPTWGLGVEYYYLPLQAGKTAESMTSTMHHINPYISLNMLNLLSPDINTKWGIWATVGGGLGLYHTKHYKNNLFVNETKNGMAITVPVGALIEYNLTPSLAIGAKVQYRSHNQDSIEAAEQYSGVTNDFISMGTVLLRWKFNANNSKKHTRNINTTTFCPDEAILPARQAQNKADSLQKVVNKLQNEIDALKPQLGKIEALENKMNEVQKIAENAGTRTVYIPQPEDQSNNTTNTKNPSHKTDFETVGRNSNIDSDGDGVPDHRDKEPQTPANTPVDFWGRTISSSKTNGFASVYFDFDRTDLDADALKTIEAVAEKLNENPEVMVEVRGYADYVGNENYNKDLSLRRADKVKNELINKFNINPLRIISNGKGIVLEPKSAYRLNRRCNFFFSEE
ncbi:MAG: OmpA family protein [Paludibacteraceae bacterium]|nr:OmpA family protein [Paludibacteraceae bacterium]